MVFNVTRKDLEKMYDNNEVSRILEIYSLCTNKRNVKVIKDFLDRDNSMSTEDIKRLLTTEIIIRIREHNRKELKNNFIPMKKSNLLKENNCINRESCITLNQIYNTKKDEYVLGVHDVQYFMDYILEDGIPYGKNAELEDKVTIINDFEELIQRISTCDDEVKSNGCIIVKVPKSALIEQEEPIYYIYKNNLYLNPKYVVCYVLVEDKKILSVEINNSYNEIESTIYEGESLDIKPIINIKIHN